MNRNCFDLKIQDPKILDWPGGIEGECGKDCCELKQFCFRWWNLHQSHSFLFLVAA
jgi:hypothetical protein